MNEKTYNTAINLTKNEIIKYGLLYNLEPMMRSLEHNVAEGFTNLVADDLKDTDNRYQLTITIKRMESE